MSWDIEPAASALWELTPDSAWALETLAEFALDLGLASLAAQAYEHASDLEPNTRLLCERLLRIGFPDRIVRHLSKQEGLPAYHRLLLARATVAALRCEV